MQHPVWNTAYNTSVDVPGNNVDEATYTPWERALPAEYSNERWILVRSKVTFANKKTVISICKLHRSIDSEMDVGHLQPTVFADVGRFRLYAGAVSDESFERFKTEGYRNLGLPANEVFPLLVAIEPPIVATRCELIVHGFGRYLWNERRVVMEA